MARFFKFHSLADLQAQCRRLELDILFREDLTPLFRPAVIGKLRAGNSLCIQPMEGCDGTLDARPDESTYPLLDDDYLKRLPDDYVAAAKLACQVGFQFVDIKQCHRYLLNELLAAKTRPGPFGGSFENRTRLAKEIIGRIRNEIPNLEVATRLNVFDGIPFRKNANAMGEPCPWKAPVLSVWGTREDNPLEPDLAEPMEWIE